MNPALLAYLSLASAIVFELIGTTFLMKSEQFTKVVPTVAMGIFYVISFFLLSQSLKVVPLGVAYAIWGGVGIAVTAIIGVVLFHQKLDAGAIIGIAMIVGGVVVFRLFSQTAPH